MKTRIPIKRYVDDPTLTWEERYRLLESHHKEETEFLIRRIEDLESQYEKFKKDLVNNTMALNSEGYWDGETEG